jgi:hypothetical protein
MFQGVLQVVMLLAMAMAAYYLRISLVLVTLESGPCYPSVDTTIRIT